VWSPSGLLDRYNRVHHAAVGDSRFDLDQPEIIEHCDYVTGMKGAAR